jgi:hypothetical protein
MPRMNVLSLLIVNMSILDYLFSDVPIDHKWKYVQFATFLSPSFTWLFNVN